MVRDENFQSLSTQGLFPAGEGAGYLPGLLDDRIHTMLPSLPRIAFGALIPKCDHITALVAAVRGSGLLTFV